MSIRHVLVAVMLSSAVRLHAATMSFAPQEVTITGATPGTAVAWFGIVIQPEGFGTRRFTITTITNDTDGDGSVTYRHLRPLGDRAVFAAIELSTGAYTTGAPTGSHATITELDSRDLVGTASDVVGFARRGDFLELLVARPEIGAWRATIGEGGPSDDDKENNGVIKKAFDQLRPIGSGVPPPSRLKSNDVLVAIEPSTLQLFIGRIGKP